MPGRKGSNQGYRYGFQGQEKDDELKGEGNSLNYTFRMHDPRVGRFFAIDPLTHKFPFYSPYHFSSNSPIMSVELEGLETSTLVNETEKQKAIEENGAFKTWLGFRILDLVEGFINVGRLTEGKPILKYPLLQSSPEENLGSVKSVFDTTFEVMGTWELAKYGIGGLDDNVSFSKNTFGIIKTGTATVDGSMNLMQKTQARLNFVVKKYASVVEKYGLNHIDYTKPVYEQQMSGTGLQTKKLVQWRDPSNPNPSSFFTFEGENPATLGIPKTHTKMYYVELKGKNNFLRSTANTVKAYSPEKDKGINGVYQGGGTQLYSQEAAKTATFTPAP